MKLLNNLDTIRIPLGANNICYFPKNNNLKGKVINNIFSCFVSSTDPINGLKPFVELSDIYITLYDKDNVPVLNEISLFELYAHYFVLIDNINAIINWEASFINVRSVYNREGNEVVLFVTYDGSLEETVQYDIRKCITIPGNYDGNFEPFINSAEYGKLVRIDFSDTNLWFNLFDFNGKNFNLCASQKFFNTQSVNDPIYLNHYSVNWQMSRIINQNNNPIQINLWFQK